METLSIFSDEVAEALKADPVPVVPEDYVPELLPTTGKNLEIVVDEARTEAVVGRLLEALENNEPPYDQDHVRRTQDPRHMPETLGRGSVGHAMFLFNLCYYMRGMVKSNGAVTTLARVYDEHPELFDCMKVVHSYDQAKIESILEPYNLGGHKKAAEAWVTNAHRLQRQFDGDPRNIFDGISTYEQCLELIQNDHRGGGFFGFQEKMTSMLAYFLIAEELVDAFNFPIPVDLHVMRVSIANKLIDFPNSPYGTNLYTDETTAALRDLYSNYTLVHDADPIRVCDAVWMLSESSCGLHPGNITYAPFGRKAGKGRSIILIPETVNVNNPTQQAAYASSCGMCPIQDTCEYNIPGTPYYVWHSLIIRGPRVRFPLPASVVTPVGQAALF